ncbi:hypothetical protein [Bacillus sp. S/N-304-OC-R1]|uniref:hypothetical protein n=1 Tax=Bacillus sp. S/N-304-OC-R1 TaxID=2758034 RepID=UPI001C8D63A0|nr:hypothetical protein [Bacillus sp. S/N-304-OC-R1]MBY0123197.1 hypothetical protein [Bacillus sp. S/N-304-OC-R1]
MEFKDLWDTKITQTIIIVFKQYMGSINWEVKQVRFHEFINMWIEYLNHDSFVNDEIKKNPSFRDDLTAEINILLEKVFNEEQNKDKESGLIIKMKELLKKAEQLRCATDQELKYASILYFHAYGEELPLRNYCKQDIEYIIEQLKMKLEEGTEPFRNSIVH